MAEPLYRQVYEELRTAIQEGVYAVGDRLPSEAELTTQHLVSAITLKRALDMLRQDGFIVRRPRLGTFVISRTPTAASPTTAPGEFPLIGCVLTNFDDTFGTRVVGGLLDASTYGAHLVLKRSLGEARAEDELVRGLISAGVQGLILQPSSSEYVPPSVLELVTRAFPVVILDRAFDGVPVSSVSSDNVQASRSATEQMFAWGYERVGFVSSTSTVSTLAERMTGYLLAHAEHHLPQDRDDVFSGVEATVPGSRRPVSDDIDAIAAFLAARPDLAAVVATEYNIALMVRSAATRLGRRVPDDLAIVCFDQPHRLVPDELFAFTHVRQDQHGLGVAAVEQTLRQIRGEAGVSKVRLTTTLVRGDSTRAEVPARA